MLFNDEIRKTGATAMASCWANGLEISLDLMADKMLLALKKYSNSTPMSLLSSPVNGSTSLYLQI